MTIIMESLKQACTNTHRTKEIIQESDMIDLHWFYTSEVINNVRFAITCDVNSEAR